MGTWTIQITHAEFIKECRKNIPLNILSTIYPDMVSDDELKEFKLKKDTGSSTKKPEGGKNA